MPAKPGKDEQVFIDLFVSAYENFAWAGSKIERLDEQKDGAPEALITRADRQTMVIEHTLIEPFVGDRSDFAEFEPPFLGIENDKSLAVPDAEITVYVPFGILHGQKPATRSVIVQTIRSWIANNRLHLDEGMQEYRCDVAGGPPVTLTVKRDSYGPPEGIVWLRRQQVTNDLDKVIEKALRKKLPKLVKTEADRHVLFLERDQFTFFPDLIFKEIERQRPNFPWMKNVDEIWHVETVFNRGFGSVRFELRKGDQVLATMTFQKGALVAHSKNGMPYPL